MNRDEQISELLTVFMQFKRHMRRELKSETSGGITVNQIELLTAVESGVTKLSDIARQASMTPSGVTQQVKLLESKGLIDHKVSEADRRQHDLRLTPDGRVYLKERHALIHAHLRKYLGTLNKQELETFTRLMLKMINQK